MKIADLRKIRNEHSSESDALEDVLLLWLNQKYDEKKHGPPTWRMLVEAVNSKSGGDNQELAKLIASNHPAGMQAIYLNIGVASSSFDSGKTNDLLIWRKFSSITSCGHAIRS